MGLREGRREGSSISTRNSAVLLLAFAALLVGSRPSGASTRHILVSQGSYGSGGGRLVGELVILDPVTGRRLKQVTDRVAPHVELSPDGRRVVWTDFRQTKGQDIWVSDVDGSHLKRLTHNHRFDSEPDWSPRGRRLVEARDNRQGGRNLWVHHASGDKTHLLIRNGTHADWARRGGRIAFSRDGILTIRPDGTSLQEVTKRSDSHSDTYPQWSPDGKWILFRRTFSNNDKALMIVRPDGSDLRVVLARANHSLRGHSWSPDGAKVLYQKVLDDLGGLRLQLRVVHRSGSHNHVAVPTFRSLYPPVASWAPDSSRFVFVRYRRAESSNASYTSDLWIAKSDGSGLRRLTTTDLIETDPYWASDPDSDNY